MGITRRFEPWTRQPPGIPEVARTALTDGLVFLGWPVGGGYTDLVTGVRGTPTGTHTPVFVPQRNGYSSKLSAGRAIQAGGGQNDYFLWPESTERGGNIVQTGTILALAGINQQTDGRTYAIGGNAEYVVLGHGFALGIDSYQFAGRGNIARGNSTANLAVSTEAGGIGNPFNDKTHFFGYSFSGNGASGTWFGRGQGVTWTGSSTFGTTTTNRRACINCYSTGDTLTHGAAHVLYLGIWNRELTLREYQQLYENPWLLIQPFERRIWVPAAGGGSRTGTASITLGAATVAATGTVLVSGTATPTLGAATLSATGTVALTGSAAVTLGAATLAGTGALAVAGTAGVTLGALTLAATGASQQTTAGEASITLGAATVAATGVLPLAGTAAVTLGALTASSTGAVALAATSAVTLGALTAAATGAVAIAGTAGVTLGALTLAATGAGQEVRTADAAITLDAATATATGTVRVAAAAAVTLGELSAAGTGRVDIAAALGVTLGNLTVTATGGQGNLGVAAITLGALVMTGTAEVATLWGNSAPPLVPREQGSARGRRTQTASRGSVTQQRRR